MNWNRIINAAAGQRADLPHIAREEFFHGGAALATLLLMDAAPHPEAALVAVAGATWRRNDPLPIQAALADDVAPALASWRADPLWALRAAWGRWGEGVAVLVGALRDRPAALRDAADLVLRSGDQWSVERCLAALDPAGWTALEGEQRAALLKKARAAALGRVWTALDETQRAAAAQAAASDSVGAALLVRTIGAAAWDATDPALRARLIDAVARVPENLPATAPAWTGMTDAERATMTMAVIERGDARDAVRLLDALGSDGRAALTADLRAALDMRGMERAAWRVLALRAADAGWDALTADERGAVLAELERRSRGPAYLLRAVGAAGWRAMDPKERDRLAAAARGAPDALFRCPPTLWSAVAGDALPPATAIAWRAMDDWCAEDAESDLGGLPPSHQAVVLALAPWRTEEATRDSVRVQRLLAAWDAMTDDDRAALATAHPLAPAMVAAAARRRGGASAAVDAVGETLLRVVTLSIGMHDAKRVAGRLIRVAARWRKWMNDLAPTDGDPPEVWDAWRDSARRGVILDIDLCARLATLRPDGAPRAAHRRG